MRTAQILSRLTTWRTPPERTCQELLHLCVQDLAVSHVSLVLMRGRGLPGVVAVTDATAAAVEELQFTLGEGPGVDCFRAGSPVLQPDLAADGPSRWPGYSEGALGLGIGAVFSVPLLAGQDRLGVLNLYGDDARPLPYGDLLQAGHYANAAVSLLLHLQLLHRFYGDDTTVCGLTLGDRAEVAQATGFVAGQVGLPPRDALALLRARAFADGRPVLLLARAVLRREVDLRER